MANGYAGDSTIRPLEKLILQFAGPRGYDTDKVFTGLLDYIIWQLDPTGQPMDYWPFKEGEGEAFKEMMLCLFQILDTEILKRGWYDAFGDLFMSLHAAGNSKGQFFTPPSVCQILAQCLLHHQEPEEYPCGRFGRRLTFSDPTAGSSRLLLAGAAQQVKVMREEWGLEPVIAYARRPYLCAEDIDFNCCKMSAINIALHGYFGESVCHDTLCEPGAVRLGYIVNESMYPFPCDVPSIRKELRPEAFQATRHWNERAKQQQEQQPADRENATAAYHSGGEAAAPAETKEKKEPQQLSLW